MVVLVATYLSIGYVKIKRLHLEVPVVFVLPFKPSLSGF